MATPRQSAAGPALKLGQQFTWSAQGINDGSALASNNNIIVPLGFPLNAYAGGDLAAQAISNLRILRPIGGVSLGSELVDGLITVYNRTVAVPTAAGAYTVRMLLAPLEVMGVTFPATEVARIVIPAATIAALTGPAVAPALLSNWTDPAGAPLDVIPVVGGNQFIAASVDVPVNTNSDDITISIDWLLQ